jgi:hypothetical protein
MIFTSHLSFTRLCQATEALARKKMEADQATVTRLVEIIGRALVLEGDRNRLIHSIWVELNEPPGAPGYAPPPSSGAYSRLRITARGRLDVQLQTDIAAQEINDVADAIQKVSYEVAASLGKLRQHGQTSGA